MGFRLLPWASVCFRDRLAAVLSLVPDIYPLSGIGKFGGRILENWKPKGAKKRLKTRILGQKLKFPASVCFRGMSSASAAVWPMWFLLFGNISRHM